MLTSINPTMISAAGAGIFVLEIGLLGQKAKVIPEKSYFAHYYFNPCLLLITSASYFGLVLALDKLNSLK